MRASPGYAPTAAPAPGYQWVSPADMQAVSNALASAIQALAIECESATAAATNPVPGWISAATNPIPSWITAATNPIPAARAAAIAAATNPVSSWIAAATNPIPAAIAAATAAATNPVPGWITAAVAPLPTYPAVTSIVDSAIAPYAEAYATGGYAITNWWEPVISPVYRIVAAATQLSTNSYLISRVDNAETGFVDYLLDYQSLDGWPYPPTWTITSGSQYAYIASNRVWATTQGVIRVSGTSSAVTRSVTLPINYGSIANPIVRPSYILPGSSAAAVADPIIYMASNYMANTVEPLVPRPNSWNTNETWRTNYAAVISAAWNSDCWLTNAPALFAPTSYSGGWGATLISPSVFVSSRHINIGVGSTRSWLTPEGAITSAVISRVVSPFPDLGIGTIDLQFGVLDRPMPTNMIAYVATHTQLATAFPPPNLYVAEYIPAVAYNQHLDASIVEISVLARSVTFSAPRLLATAPYSELFHHAHPGDSSRPIILPWGDKPVLLALYYYSYFGSSISSQIETIASVVAAEGETLQYIDFTEAP
jgi:hypothetical protein